MNEEANRPPLGESNGAMENRVHGALTIEASKACLLLVHLVRFVVGWLSWRKWLRASGLLDYAYGVDGMTCGTQTTASIVALREYVFHLEDTWLRENTNELLAARRDVKYLYELNGEEDTTPSIFVSPVLRATVRAVLADLGDLTVRRRYLGGRVLVNVQQRGELYSYDYTLCTFLDETIDLMLRTLEHCFTERNTYASLYEASDNLPHGPAISAFNRKILVPLRVAGREIAVELDRRAPSRYLGHVRSLLFDLLELNDASVGLLNPEARNFDVLRPKTDVPLETLLAHYFSHTMIRRAHVRSLLRVNYETVDAKAVLVAGLLNSGRIGSANTTVETLVRAMRIGTVAIYRLVYLCRANGARTGGGHRAARADESKELADIANTLFRMGDRRANAFPLNGFEAVSSLGYAVFKLLFQHTSAVGGDDYDANRQTLMSVSWYEDYPTLSKDLLENGTSARGNENAVQAGLIMLATSVLFDVDTLLAELRTRGPCVDTPLNANRGLYLRHARYEQLGLLLLPAESSPVYDRFVTVNPLTVCDTDWTNNDRAGRNNEDGRKFRLCVLFPEARASDYRSVMTQLGLATLVTDLVEYFFPKSLDVIGSGDPDNVAPDSPNVGNLVAARVRALLAKLLTFDQFQGLSPSTSESRVPHYVLQLRRLAQEKVVVCASKLWQVLRQLSDGCRAYVRSSSVVYSPFYSDRGISQMCGGIRPITVVNRHDSWKVYMYVRGARSGTGDEARPTERELMKRAIASFNTYTDCRAFRVSEAGKSGLLNNASLPLYFDEGSSCDEFQNGDGGGKNRRRQMVDLFEEAAGRLIVTDGEEDEAQKERRNACSDEELCSTLFRRLSSDPGGASRLVNLVCIADKTANNWCVHVFRGKSSFDEYVRLHEVMTGVRIVDDAVPVLLLGWYIDQYDFGDLGAPLIEKVSSKRVYLINGFLAFCEQPTKVVSVYPERIARVPRPFRACRRNFANYSVDQRDEVCFTREVTKPDANFVLPVDHFYHRVYRPMYERNANAASGSLVCTMVQASPFYYVLRLFDARFWFPTIRLLNAARASPDGTLCYDPAPMHTIPLISQYVYEAVRSSDVLVGQSS